jgi:glycerophosphoryl diester phosphodiesterase
MSTKESFVTRLRRNGRPSVVGHRGSMGHRPENTLAAFAHAAKQGAEWIELDVQLSKDGVPVVLHDTTLGRTTNGKGAVAQKTAAQLAKLDAGSWYSEKYAGEGIPSLDGVLAWAKENRIGVEIEIKNDPRSPEALVRAVVESVERCEAHDDVLVIGFDHRAVKRVTELEPRLATGVLYVGRPFDEVRLAKDAGASVLVPHASFVTAEGVARAHGAGLAVATWAETSKVLFSELVEAGVDAITVDHPEVLRKLLDHGLGAGKTRAKSGKKSARG